MAPIDKLLTAAEVAQLLCVQTSTIREWARIKKIPSIKVGHRTVRYDGQEVVEALKGEQQKHDMT